MSIKLKEPTAAHRAFRDELIAVAKKHGATMDGAEILAVASYLVGQLVALQDQRKFTGAMAMQIVASNIEAGNQQAISESLSLPLGRG